MYVESRRMVLTNLFEEQQWRHKLREQTYGQGQWRRWGGCDEWREQHGCIYTNICKQPMGICYMTQGTQTGSVIT